MHRGLFLTHPRCSLPTLRLGEGGSRARTRDSKERPEGAARVLDVLMVVLTVAFFAASFALVAWLERV